MRHYSNKEMFKIISDERFNSNYSKIVHYLRYIDRYKHDRDFRTDIRILRNYRKNWVNFKERRPT